MKGQMTKPCGKIKSTDHAPRVDKVLLESSKNPYTYMIFDVFGTLFIIKVLL